VSADRSLERGGSVLWTTLRLDPNGNRQTPFVVATFTSNHGARSSNNCCDRDDNGDEHPFTVPRELQNVIH
jgi:hypothetical protein